VWPASVGRHRVFESEGLEFAIRHGATSEVPSFTANGDLNIFTPDYAMKHYALTIALLLPIASQAAGSTVGAFMCPEGIKTSQSLFESVSGWSETQERSGISKGLNNAAFSEHKLAQVDFSFGPPEGRMWLAPDRSIQGPKGLRSSTWNFQRSEEIWFSCRYSGTSVLLSRQIAPGLKSCSVNYSRNQGMTVENVSCQ
jgi:hypothetical protein